MLLNVFVLAKLTENKRLNELNDADYMHKMVNLEKPIMLSANLEDEQEEEVFELETDDIEEIDVDVHEDIEVDEDDILLLKRQKDPRKKRERRIRKRIIRQAVDIIEMRGIDFCHLLFSKNVCRKAIISLTKN